MAKFTYEIFANCMSGVESGGQIYGNGAWDCLILQYKNSPYEHAITIGAYQRMGVMAKSLLERIRKDYPDTFRKYDTAGIGQDMDKYPSWASYQLSSEVCEKAKAIKSIISTPEGIKVQKKLMAEEAQSYANMIEQNYGIHRIDALLHLVNVQHLGGTEPLERIISRISGEVTLKKVRDSLLQDKTYNQVGAEPYRSRQELMYQWIHEKITPLLNANGLINENKKENNHMGISAKQIIDIMEGWVGLNRSNGTHKPIIEEYNSYIQSHPGSGRGYTLSMKDDYCDATVSAAFIKCDAVDLIGGVECGVEEHINIFKKKGIWNEDGTITPKPGDIICYNWDDATQPNDGYADHIGIVKSVDKSKKTMVVIEGNTDGGKVGKHTIPFGYGYIRGFACPEYEKSEETNKTNSSKGDTYMFEVKTVQKGVTGNDVKLLQRLLKSNGCKGKDGKSLTIDGSCGDNTVYAIKEYQKKKKLEVDGCAGTATWKSILLR